MLKALSDLAPVDAIRGNNDVGALAKDLPERKVVTVGELRVLLLHDVSDLEDGPPDSQCAIVVCGHSHRPGVGEHDGHLVVNPGSAGPRRFRLPIGIARLWLTPPGINLAPGGSLHCAFGFQVELVPLAVAPGPQAHPGRARHTSTAAHCALSSRSQP